MVASTSITKGAATIAIAVKGVAGPFSLLVESSEMGLREKSRVASMAALVEGR